MAGAFKGRAGRPGPFPGPRDHGNACQTDGDLGPCGLLQPPPRWGRHVAQREPNPKPLQAEVREAAERAPSRLPHAAPGVFLAQRVFPGNYLFHLRFQIY